MAKHKTTKELEAERERQLNDRKHIAARGVLSQLLQAKDVLLRVNTKESRAIAGDVSERIDWLLAESEVYRNVAVELWRQGQTGDHAQDFVNSYRSLGQDEAERER